MKAKDPVEAYNDMVKTARDLRETPTIDELPLEQQSWLRAR